MANELMFTLIFVGSVLVNSVSQLMLKKSAMKEYPTVIAGYLNPTVITAYLLFFCSTLITIIAFKYVALSMGPVLETLGFVFVAILSYLVLKERVSKRVFIGMLLIVAGVFIAAL